MNTPLSHLLLGLLKLSSHESPKLGNFRVSLDYDNYQDGARVLNGDGDTIAECYDIPPCDQLDAIDGEDSARWQMLRAIRRACGEDPGPDHLSGAELIMAERERQQSQEGWNAAHDDEHDCRELAYAATDYLMFYTGEGQPGSEPEEGKTPSRYWPFEPQAWKPSDDPIRNLAKAGALVASEMDRLLRLRQPQPPQS